MRLKKILAILFLVFSFNSYANLPEITERINIINEDYKNNPEKYEIEVFDIFQELEKNKSTYEESELIETLYTLGDIMVYYPQGEEEGLRLNNWGIELATKHNHEKIAYFYFFKAMYSYYGNRDIEDNKKAYKTAIKFALIKEQKDILSTAYSFLADLYSSQGNLKKALDYYKKAEYYYTEPIEYLNIKYGISSLFYNLGIYELVVETIQEALTLMDQHETLSVPKIDYQLMFYQLLTIVYIKEADYENALKYSNMNIDLVQGYYDDYMIISAYFIHSLILSHINEFEEAIKYTEMGKKLMDESGIKDHILIHNYNLSLYKYFIFQKKYEEGKKVLKKLEAYLEKNDPAGLTRIYDRLSMVLKNLGEYKESLKYQRKHTENYIEMRNQEESILALFLHENYKDVKIESQNKLLEKEKLEYEIQINKNIEEQIKNEKLFVFISTLTLVVLMVIVILQFAYIKNNQIAISDVLTKSYNRRFAVQKINEIKKKKKKMTAMLFDIDNFKKINDTYGHEIGDEILIEIVEIINNYLDKEDFICRVGGEEFLIISEKIKRNLSEDIRKLIESNNFKEVGKVTLSAGNEFVDKNKITRFEDFYKILDDKLYEAKKSGKNMVVF